MNNEIIKSCKIPAACGRIPNPGWARSEVMKYTRENIKAPWFRKKEWDYYLFNTDEFAVAFTISDLGYAGLLSASFIDLVNGTEHTQTELTILPMGRKYGLGASVEKADAHCHSKNLDMEYVKEGTDLRRIRCDFKHFDGDKDLKVDLLIHEPKGDALYIATPWKEKPTAFYYNCKWNCLEAEGTVIYGDKQYTMTRKNSLGVLDWGRGVWTYDNTWYWGTGSGRVNGESFGFNLGYGFSDRSSASENAIFYKNKIHKLGEITFHIPQKNDFANDCVNSSNSIAEAGTDNSAEMRNTVASTGYNYLGKWKVTSDDGRFEADFSPILDRNALMDLKLIISDQHQVFGCMSGTAILDDGTHIDFNDFICALEVVRNKY